MVPTNLLENPLFGNLFEFDHSPKISTCQGSIFRAEVQHFKIKRGFGFKTRLQRLKRLSCPGCAQCNWEYEDFSEIGNDYPIENIEKAVHGKLYTIDCITDSIDYESGIVDDWHLRLVGPLDEEVLKQKNKILTFQ